MKTVCIQYKDTNDHYNLGQSDVHGLVSWLRGEICMYSSALAHMFSLNYATVPEYKDF